MNPTPIVPVILSGGSGTRLWPVSRESFPKQLWPLISDHTLLQETALRARGDRFAPPVVVCNQEHRFLIAEQLRAAGIASPRILLEPVGRNSAPAIAAAAVLVAEDDPDAVLWLLAADHVIADTEVLHARLATAAQAARAGHIVTFGMRPTAPETGYGYIAIGAALDDAPGAFAVAHFIEKPVAATRGAPGDRREAPVELGHVRVHRAHPARGAGDPRARRAARGAPRGGRTPDRPRLHPARRGGVHRLPLDQPRLRGGRAHQPRRRGAGRYRLVGCRQLGRAVGPRAARTQHGNVAVGDVLLEAARNCYVRSDGMLTAVVGLEDAVVVVTEDAVLAMHRDHAQDVKKVVDRLKAAGRHEAVAHNRMYRPWGFYERLILGERFQVKRIVVSPGRKLSLQKHYHRAEHWVVVNGSALVTRDNETMLMRENESVYLPLGCVHRLENPGKIPLALIEVQSGAYLGEDDIVRIDDVYNRTSDD